MELFRRAERTTAGDDDLGGAQFGAVRLNLFLADKGRLGGVGARDAFDRGRAALFRRLEGGGTHGDHLLGVRGLDRLQRIAGVDRAHEGVDRHHLDDVRDGRHVQLGRDARGEVLAVVGRGRQDRIIVAGQRQHRRLDRFGQGLAQARALGQQNPAHARDLRRGVGGGLSALPHHQDVDVAAQRLRGRHGLVGGVADGRTVVIGDDKNGHLTELPLRS